MPARFNTGTLFALTLFTVLLLHPVPACAQPIKLVSSVISADHTSVPAGFPVNITVAVGDSDGNAILNGSQTSYVAGAVISGTVSIAENSNVDHSVYASGTLSNNRVTISVTLPEGDHLLLPLIAPTSGGFSNTAGLMVVRVQVGGQQSSTTTLTVSPTMPTADGLVSLIARVQLSGNLPALGSVSLFQDGALLAVVPLVNGVGTFRMTLPPGSHRLSASYSSVAPGSQSEDILVTVPPSMRQSTTTSVQVSPSTSVPTGTPVTFNINVAGTPTLSGSITITEGASSLLFLQLPLGGKTSVTLSALRAGTHSLTFAYSGDGANFPSGINVTVTVGPLPPSPVTITAAPDGSSSVSPLSIASLFGTALASAPTQPPGSTLPGSLLGVAVIVRDSQNRQWTAPLFYVSPAQINFLVPSETATGAATVTVTNSQLGTSFAGSMTVETVAPAIFSANGSGTGAPAAFVVTAKGETGGVSQQYTAICSSTATCSPAPLSLGGPLDRSVLVLFGTGWHSATAGAVEVRAGEVSLPVLYVGPQSEYMGLDQLNVALPHTLDAAGVVPLNVTIQGRRTKTLSLLFQ